MTLPTAFCVGAQKAGTTTLSEIFKRHDQVFVPPKKEVHYFENKSNFIKGPDWYVNHFADAKLGQLVMDFTPDYLQSDVCANRIAELCGDDCKIIIALRHPVDRAFSQYNFYRRYDVEKAPSFEQALEADTVRSFSECQVWHDPKLYVLRSLYYDAINRFRNVFSPDNVLLLKFEDVMAPGGQTKAVNEITRFLGIDPMRVEADRRSNVTLAPPPGAKSLMYSALRQMREPLKRMAPGQSYDRIRDWGLNRILERPAKLPPALRQELFERYFKQDAEKLETFGVVYS